MSILVICGFGEPACAVAHSALKLAGLPEAGAFHNGEFSAETLTKKICHAYKLNGKKRKGYAQVSPGKVWQALSVELMLANMETESWGWADPKNVYFLDYWRDFDPRFHFVLVYSSPEQVLARLLERGPVEPGAAEAALAEWRAYNEEMLRFYNANPGRSILVNAEVIGEGPVDFLSASQERFDLDLRRINEPLDLDAKVSAMALWAASALFSDFREAAALFDELQSAADLPRGATPDMARISGEAWSQYTAMSKELDAASSRLDAETAALRELEAQNRSLRQAIEALEAELDRARLDLAGAETQKSEMEKTAAALRQEKEGLAGEKEKLARDSAAAATGLRAETQAARKENELLLLQLHQVQEELESYFHKYRGLQPLEEQNRSLRQSVEALEAELDKARLGLVDAKAQKSELEKTAAALRQDKERLTSEKGKLASEKEKLTGEKEKLARDSAATANLRTEAEGAKKENELLLLQLHQVQEELEHYFLKYRDLQAKGDGSSDGAPAAASATQAAAGMKDGPVPTEAQPTVIDMRYFIDGQNWHNAEDDGRWAGPDRRSTLRLPKLGKGRYRLEIDIVDAMSPEIVRQMRISLNGAPVAMTRRSMDSLAGMLAPLKRAYLVHYKRQQLYPLRFSGVVDIDGEAGRTPLQIEFDFPDTVSPASRGEADSRNLAIRLKQVAITPC